MPIIHKLSSHEAQKIAAGEVVERPANVVKELLENALDAHATDIEVHVIDAGKKSIRVKDNGIGMDTVDAKYCFEHHATSKITSVEDLNSISTFGFRGEALSSIASVSTIILTTKQKENTEGIAITMQNGTPQQETMVAATTGTDIIITDLFNNMPARKKFLKSRQTEWNHIKHLFFATVLDYIQVSFKLFSEGKLLYNCPATDCLKKRWMQIQDSDVNRYMIPLKSPDANSDFSFEGVISSQQYGRYDRNGIYIFVNNRWVKDYKLNRALINGYHNALPTHQYPVACIKMKINPAWIDVNIHPRKEEVLFLYPHKIYSALKKAVHYTLESFITTAFSVPNNEQLHRVESSDTSNKPVELPKKNSSTENFVPFDFDLFFSEPLTSAEKKQPKIITHIPPILEKKPAQNEDVIKFEKKNHYRIIGTFNKTYILAETDNELIVIDQHAAHERILYEQFKSTRNPATVQLLFPQTITYSMDIIQLLKPYLPTLCKQGIQAELFSDTQIAIKATPVQLKNASLKEIINECIAVLHQEKHYSQEIIAENFKKALHADMACKAAVKAGDSLSQEQIAQLISDIQKTPNRFSCPHDRPTMWQLPLDSIKKKFKRDYRS